MTEHVGELAELYAVGSLDEAETDRLERHAAECAACAERLYAAETAAAAIAQAQATPVRERPPALAGRLNRALAHASGRAPAWQPFAVAVAAAIVLALIPAWVAVDRNASLLAMRQDERALARIASSATQIDHAQFVSSQNRPMDAKVLYGPRGDWYYVVVMHPRAGMQVAYVHGGRMEMLGTIAVHGESGTLYLPVNHKMDELALLEGSSVVADARLAY